MGITNTPSGFLPGTLDLLILKALVAGTKHGYGIVEHLTSGDILQVGESALYPALQRIQRRTVCIASATHRRVSRNRTA